MIKYIWIWMLVGVYVIWGIFAIIDLVRAIVKWVKDNTIEERIFNGEIPPPMKKKFVYRTSLLETIDKETSEYTWWFVLLSIGALFVISFGAFFISCCKDISSH